MGNFLPEQASTFAAQVDQMYIVLTLLALAFAVPIAALIVYFGVRYRRGANVDRTGALHESTKLEVSWVLLLLLISLPTFLWGARLYATMYTMPADALEVYVLGRQWMWQMQYPNGQREINLLHVPVGRPVRLTMISQDVIHSFYVPAFRVKHDVLPGIYTTMWFEATQAGEYDIFCAEYCGTEHSGMVGKVIALEPRQYEEWLRTHVNYGADPIPESSVGSAAEGQQTMAQTGEQLFVNFGCSSCHLPNGQGIGPSLVGLLGSEQEMEDGQVIVADAQYIRRSILDPRSQIVRGYPPVMPTYEGQIDEQELFSLVEYISSLTNPADAQQAPDSNPAIETGSDTTPGDGPEEGEPIDQPDDSGQEGSGDGSSLSGDQPDAANDNPTGSNETSDNLSGDQPDAADDNPSGEGQTGSDNGNQGENDQP